MEEYFLPIDDDATWGVDPNLDSMVGIRGHMFGT